MRITINVGPRKFHDVDVVSELPEIGKPFHYGLISAAEVKGLEPYPYTYPQDDRPENYKYSVWRVIYRPDNLVEDAAALVAIHETDAEKI